MRAQASLSVLAVAAGLAVGCGGEPPPPGPTPAATIHEVGVDRGQGKLLAVQAWLQPLDYATAERFEGALRALLARADDEGLIDERTVVVLPEYAGTWLVALDEGVDAYRAPTVGDAMTPVAFSNLVPFLFAQGSSKVKSDDVHAVFTVKAERMAEAYQGALSTLAREFAVTLVGGSIVLPAPRVEGGRIVVEPGAPLVNASFVFRPSGEVEERVVVKAFPTKTELDFTLPGDPAELPVFDTPAGRLGVLVCADSWFPAAYDALAAQDVEIVAVPAFMEGERGFFTAPWKGYSGHERPDDVDADDVGLLTEQEAWVKYALPGRMSTSTAARAGVVAALRGSLWDLGDEGQSMLVAGDQATLGPLDDAPALLALWL